MNKLIERKKRLYFFSAVSSITTLKVLLKRTYVLFLSPFKMEWQTEILFDRYLFSLSWIDNAFYESMIFLIPLKRRQTIFNTYLNQTLITNIVHALSSIKNIIKIRCFSSTNCGISSEHCWPIPIEKVTVVFVMKCSYVNNPLIDDNIAQK